MGECLPYLKATNDSWRVDETYIKVKKQWVYLYRAVDSQGNTLDFFFSSTRDAQAARQFFLKTLAASHTSEPQVINVDKNAAYPKAFNELKDDRREADVQKCRVKVNSRKVYCSVFARLPTDGSREAMWCESRDCVSLACDIQKSDQQ